MTLEAWEFLHRLPDAEVKVRVGCDPEALLALHDSLRRSTAAGTLDHEFDVPGFQILLNAMGESLDALSDREFEIRCSGPKADAARLAGEMRRHRARITYARLWP